MSNSKQKAAEKAALKTSGITLIETVLYLALLSVIFAISMPLLIEQNMWQSKQNSFADTVRDYLFIAGRVESLVRSGEFDELETFEPAELLASTTRVDDFAISYQTQNDIETLDFSLHINEKNFGTTTFLINANQP